MANVPTWLVAAGSALLGASAVAIGLLATSAPTAAVAVATATLTETVTATAPGPTLTVSVTATPRASPTRTEPVAPHGTLTVAVPISQGYGQGFGSGQCSSWSVILQNNSDAGVIGVTITAPTGVYENSENSLASPKPAKPPTPLALNVSLPAHTQQQARFQLCTTTRSPGSTWTFNTSGGLQTTVLYANGYRGPGGFSVY